ncbi:MAG: hypothetical protein KDC57_00035 [Saprospiraceae bacterium]|nr:hypothetical protein [Saprospiraceae bacterium]
MNRLKGTIIDFREEEHLLQVQIALPDASWQVLLIDSASARKNLRPGEEMVLLFKETSLILGQPACQGIGLQNRLICQVHHITSGPLLSRIELLYQGNYLVAIIPTGVLTQFDCRVGEPVSAWVRANELILEN